MKKRVLSSSLPLNHHWPLFPNKCRVNHWKYILVTRTIALRKNDIHEHKKWNQFFTFVYLIFTTLYNGFCFFKVSVTSNNQGFRAENYPSPTKRRFCHSFVNWPVYTYNISALTWHNGLFFVFHLFQDICKFCFKSWLFLTFSSHTV